MLIKFILWLLEGGVNMVDMYLALVMNHRRQISAGGPLRQVPVEYAEEVMLDLTALGLDGFGNEIAQPVV